MKARNPTAAPTTITSPTSSVRGFAARRPARAAGLLSGLGAKLEIPRSVEAAGAVPLASLTTAHLQACFDVEVKAALARHPFMQSLSRCGVLPEFDPQCAEQELMRLRQPKRLR